MKESVYFITRAHTLSIKFVGWIIKSLVFRLTFAITSRDRLHTKTIKNWGFLGAMKMTQWTENLLHKYKDLSSDRQHLIKIGHRGVPL